MEGVARRLLVACDFSSAARCALEQAANVASRLGSSLLVVHVERSEWRAWKSSGMSERHAVDRLARWWKGPLSREGLEVRTKVLRDHDVAGAIAEVALVEGVDLIITGEPGRRSRSWWGRPSTTERLVRLADQPVWVVRRGERKAALPRDILCGFDGSDESVEALRFARSFSQDLGAHLSVVHLVGLPDMNPLGMTPSEEKREYERYKRERLEQTRRDLARHGVPGTTATVLWGDGPEGLLHALEDEGADLVVVGRGRSSDFKRLVSNTTAAKLLREAPAAVVFMGEGRLRRAEQQGKNLREPLGRIGL